MSQTHLASIADIIEDAQNGRMFILVDDETRENEGDLVIPAQMATPEVVNFMAMHGRGLICLALPRERVEHLGLNLMSPRNRSRMQTAFTVSIEAREGVTTGISAADRAHTIQVAIDPSKRPEDIVSPGHIFPLKARDGGVLVRAGHTEAAVDIARLAGLNPAGVICEIMNDDGTMARMPDLIKFAEKHKLKIATIADLISYRRRFDKLVERLVETEFESQYGGKFNMIVYANRIEYGEHLALIKGKIDPSKPTLVRMHAISALHDMLGDTFDGRGGELQAAMRQIGNEESGVIVIIRDTSKTAISDRLRARAGDQPRSVDLRDYGIGAQILLDLGIKEMILLSNTRRSVVGLEGYGLKIADYRPIET